jgi:hypothetical protein
MGDFDKIEFKTDPTVEPDIKADVTDEDKTSEGGVKISPTDAEAHRTKEPDKELDGRPEWLPEKFETPEALVKSYGELEKLVGGDKPTPKPAESKIDVEAVAAEYADKGQLSEETYDLLETHGLSRNYMDRYIAGQEALAREYHGELAEVVGGEETLGHVLEWARDNIGQEDQLAYNRAVDADNVAEAKMLLRGIAAQYTAKEGKEPSLVVPTESAPRVSGVAPFASLAQQTAAIQDPRYDKDPAYRQEVMDRIAASTY